MQICLSAGHDARRTDHTRPRGAQPCDAGEAGAETSKLHPSDLALLIAETSATLILCGGMNWAVSLALG